MEQSATSRDVLTAEELAVRLRMHVNTITKMAREGKLPGLRAGRDWRFYWPAVVETMSRVNWVQDEAAAIPVARQDTDSPHTAKTIAPDNSGATSQ
ncbi:MAG: helix-turn-helix domain-containing protein [Longispora sp.]|nr:helix-turn-helix domain-containing protein [Longispora sp. (in: high G+C Gram-positive bacteria)]